MRTSGGRHRLLGRSAFAEERKRRRGSGGKEVEKKEEEEKGEVGMGVGQRRTINHLTGVEERSMF